MFGDTVILYQPRLAQDFREGSWHIPNMRTLTKPNYFTKYIHAYWKVFHVRWNLPLTISFTRWESQPYRKSGVTCQSTRIYRNNNVKFIFDAFSSRKCPSKWIFIKNPHRFICFIFTILSALTRKRLYWK